MSEIDDNLLNELLKTFRVEAAEHAETINQSLLKLERVPKDEKKRQELIQNAFRAAHSLKGAARAVNLKRIEAVSHAMESVFQQVRDDGLVLDANMCDVLYESVDVISNLLENKKVDIDAIVRQLNNLVVQEQEQDLRPTAPPSEGISEISNIEEPDQEVGNANNNDETIRVSVNKLDDLMAQVGELLISKINSEQRLMDVDQISYQLNQWSKTWRDIQSIIPHMKTDVGHQLNESLARHMEFMQEIQQSVSQFNQNIRRDSVRLDMVTSGLQDKVRHVRMVPFQSLILGLERAVRDVARVENKQIKFISQGTDVELDKQVLETLKDPLMHLLRNAVSHGVEFPDEREAKGKLAEGRISLKISQRGSEVRIAIIDDGRGFDIDSLREVSERRGVNLSDKLSKDEVIGVAFQSGISTASEVTAISGRGVGLDVVRQSLESIQGRVSVETDANYGTTIELIVPTSLAMTRGLMVCVGKEQYVLPLLSVEKIQELDEVLVVGGRDVIKVNGDYVPLVSLATVLERPHIELKDDVKSLAVIMAVANQRLALLVDDVLTEQEMAVKAVGAPLKRVRNVVGSALLGSGEPIIVLNPADLIKSADKAKQKSLINIRQKQTDNNKKEHMAHILVVDDSITTRTLEKNILEAAGYRITTATHGLEALQRLEEHAVDLVVSDIQMPHMDGIGLTTQLRQTDAYSSLPIILVTSLESREDREKGMLAGADAYIVKRGFNQAELLATIQRLL